MPEHLREPGEALDLREQHISALHAGLSEFAGTQKIGVAQCRTRCLQTECGKAVKDGLRQSVPVVQYEREKPDIEDFPCESLDHLVFPGGPSQCCEHHIDANEDLDEEPDIAGNQSNAAVDIAAEDVEEAIDDGDVVAHDTEPISLLSAVLPVAQLFFALMPQNRSPQRQAPMR